MRAKDFCLFARSADGAVLLDPFLYKHAELSKHFPKTLQTWDIPFSSKERIFFTCSRAWIRTKISRFRVCCPAIRRPGNVSIVSMKTSNNTRERKRDRPEKPNGLILFLHTRIL